MGAREKRERLFLLPGRILHTEQSVSEESSRAKSERRGRPLANAISSKCKGNSPLRRRLADVGVQTNEEPTLVMSSATDRAAHGAQAADPVEIS